MVLATFRVRPVTFLRGSGSFRPSEPRLFQVEPDPDPATPHLGPFELAVDQRTARLHHVETLRRPEHPVAELAELLGGSLARRAGKPADPKPGVEGERIPPVPGRRERVQPFPQSDVSRGHRT